MSDHYRDTLSMYSDREDDLPRVTIPASVTPGERFAEKAGLMWDVYDWHNETCSTCCPTPDHPPPAGCPGCKGTGLDGCMTPELVVSGLQKEDALLLVYGGALLSALTDLVAATDPQRMPAVTARVLTARKKAQEVIQGVKE